MLARLLKSTETAPDVALTSREPALPKKPNFLVEAEAASRAARKARAEIEARFHEILNTGRNSGNSHPSPEMLAVQRQLDAASATVADARAAVTRARRKFGPAWRAEVEPVVTEAEEGIHEALATLRRHADLLGKISDFAESNGNLPRPGLSMSAQELRRHVALVENICRRPK